VLCIFPVCWWMGTQDLIASLIQRLSFISSATAWCVPVLPRVHKNCGSLSLLHCDTVVRFHIFTCCDVCGLVQPLGASECTSPNVQPLLLLPLYCDEHFNLVDLFFSLFFPLSPYCVPSCAHHHSPPSLGLGHCFLYGPLSSLRPSP
jgi:hypothetical protein